MTPSQPLEGIRVVETAGVLAGPSIGMFLAELGAEVVKVENPRGGDVTRSWLASGESAERGVSAYFSSVNWGKRSVAIDLTSGAGREILLELARRADVIITSHRRGEESKLGLAYGHLSSLNPRLIYARVTAYGPEDERPGYDAVIQAEAGFMAMNGDPHGPPTKMPVALIDVLAAHQLKEAILLALYLREKTGNGADVSASLFGSAVASLVNQATNWLQAGKLPRRMGSEHPNISPYGAVYRCRDRRDIVLAVGTDRHFKGLCSALGRPELAEERRFATNRERVVNREELSALLAAEISAHDREDLMCGLTSRGVPAGAINDMSEVFSDPRASEMVLRDERGAAGVRSIGFSGVAAAARLSPPPGLGEHTSSVLEELGVPRETEERLRAEGVIL